MSSQRKYLSPLVMSTSLKGCTTSGDNEGKILRAYTIMENGTLLAVVAEASTDRSASHSRIGATLAVETAMEKLEKFKAHWDAYEDGWVSRSWGKVIEIIVAAV